MPTREGILDELDDLADRTVALMVSEKEELEIESDEDLDKALIAEGFVDGVDFETCKEDSDEDDCKTDGLKDGDKKDDSNDDSDAGNE